ncbi:MAG: hypothetical protein B6V02_03390 [Thermoprotei archaeon ex4572_64]|nr:MAG: hypothetical protein B6V02_03390 [Thermoprotei archaeon ex4572_64]
MSRMDNLVEIVNAINRIIEEIENQGFQVKIREVDLRVDLKSLSNCKFNIIPILDLSENTCELVINFSCDDSNSYMLITLQLVNCNIEKLIDYFINSSLNNLSLHL